MNRNFLIAYDFPTDFINYLSSSNSSPLGETKENESEDQDKKKPLKLRDMVLSVPIFDDHYSVEEIKVIFF